MSTAYTNPKVPVHDPGQHHVEPPWLSDSKKAPRAAGAKGKRGGSNLTDSNITQLLDGCGVIHDETPRQGGWRYLAMGKGKPRRALTNEELDRPYRLWPKAKFVRLRRTKRAGIKFESRVRPLLYVESLHLHQVFGARPVWEAKTPFSAEMVRSMASIARAHRMPFWVKTLVHQSRKPVPASTSMATAGKKLQVFHANGARTILATHGYPPPPDLEQWRPHIDAYWGAKSELYREAKR